MKRIGVYSGTFDPIHTGHLGFACQAIDKCKLDKVYFLVEPRPRRKQGVKALEHRDEMVQIAIKNYPKLGNIVLGQQRFTAVDTLPILLERFKGAELFMLMGDDMLAHFANWPHVEELVEQIQFTIGIRKFTKQEVMRRLSIIQKTRGLAMRYELFSATKPEYSSSNIKQQIKQGKEPEGLFPEVKQYIKENNLYASSKLGS